MKKLFFLVIACITGFAGCKSAGQVQPSTAGNSGTPQGTVQPVQRENPYLKMIDQSIYTPFISEQVGPLPDHIVVKVAQWGILDGYDVLGYAEIPGDSIQDRIRFAEKYARAYGADVIMAKGIISKEQLKSTYRDRMTQGFLIWRRKPTSAAAPQITVIDTMGKKVDDAAPKATEPKKQDDSLLQDLSEETGTPSKVFSQYVNLPRLTYKKLLENSAEIKSQDYRAASYALKLFKIPEDLGIEVKGDQKMAMLATKSGENKLFLIISADRTQWIQDYIKADKVMEFVYRPVGVYKEKYPILQFVDEMK